MPRANISRKVTQQRSRSANGSLLGVSACHDVALADGTVLRVTVDCPSRRATRGIVLFVHGFAGDQHENGLFDELAGSCVRAGLTAVRYDWRGLGKSEGAFESTALEDHCSDLQDVLRWLQAAKAKAPSPISVVGF